MSRSSALRKIADARRLLDEGLRELAEESGDDPSSIESESRIKISDVDRARARLKLRKRGVRI